MRLCQVGCGEHARVAHGPSQARCARERGDLVLAGCSDLDAARAEAFRRDFGYGRAFTDAAAMLDAERPDAVVVVVPVERTVGGRVDGPRAGPSPSPREAARRDGGRGRSPDRRRRGRGTPGPAPGRLQPPLRPARPGAAPADRGGGAAAAPPLRDDAGRAPRPRLLDDRHPRPRRRAVPRRLRLRGGPLPLPRDAGARARRREHPRGRGDGLGRHRAPGVLPGGRGAGGARDRARARALAARSRADVERGRLARPAVALRGRAARRGPRRRGGGRRDRALRARAASTARRSPSSTPLAAGRAPSPSLRESRQSVEIAEQVRHRAAEYRA